MRPVRPDIAGFGAGIRPTEAPLRRLESGTPRGKPTPGHARRIRHSPHHPRTSFAAIRARSALYFRRPGDVARWQKPSCAGVAGGARAPDRHVRDAVADSAHGGRRGGSLERAMDSATWTGVLAAAG